MEHYTHVMIIETYNVFFLIWCLYQKVWPEGEGFQPTQRP